MRALTPFASTPPSTDGRQRSPLIPGTWINTVVPLPLRRPLGWRHLQPPPRNRLLQPEPQGLSEVPSSAECVRAIGARDVLRLGLGRLSEEANTTDSTNERHSDQAARQPVATVTSRVAISPGEERNLMVSSIAWLDASAAEQRRIRDDRPRDGDALLLAAGQFARLVVHAVLQADL